MSRVAEVVVRPAGQRRAESSWPTRSRRPCGWPSAGSGVTRPCARPAHLRRLPAGPRPAGAAGRPAVAGTPGRRLADRPGLVDGQGPRRPSLRRARCRGPRRPVRDHEAIGQVAHATKASRQRSKLLGCFASSPWSMPRGVLRRPHLRCPPWPGRGGRGAMVRVRGRPAGRRVKRIGGVSRAIGSSGSSEVPSRPCWRTGGGGRLGPGRIGRPVKRTTLRYRTARAGRRALAPRGGGPLPSSSSFMGASGGRSTPNAYAPALRRSGGTRLGGLQHRVPQGGPFGSGGWPETFDDVAAAIDALAGVDGIDRRRVVTCGHSAGGHLALWAATRRATGTIVGRR